MRFRGVAKRFVAVEIIFRILNQKGISCMMIYFFFRNNESKGTYFNYNKNKTRKHPFVVFLKFRLAPEI